MQGIVNAVVPRFTDAFIKKTRQCNRNIDNSFGYHAIMSHDLISQADPVWRFLVHAWKLEKSLHPIYLTGVDAHYFSAMFSFCMIWWAAAS